MLVLPLLVALTSVVFARVGHVRLIAGGGNPNSAMDVGYVEVTDVCEETVVRYRVIEGCCLKEVHLQIFEDKEEFTDVPHNNGGPIPGQFEYKYEFDDCKKQFDVPTGPLGPGMYVAAHAVVECCDPDPCCEDCCYTETAWGGCIDPEYPFQLPGKNWAMYFQGTD
jgi:hypothetical protein